MSESGHEGRELLLESRHTERSLTFTENPLPHKFAESQQRRRAKTPAILLDLLSETSTVNEMGLFDNRT